MEWPGTLAITHSYLKHRAGDWYIIYTTLCNNVISLCIFIGCWPWCIKGHTQRWRQIHIRSRQRTCFSFFMPPNSFNKPFEFLLYKTNRLHFSVRGAVILNRLEKTCKEHRSRHSTATRVVVFVLYTLWCHMWSITAHTRKNVIYLLIKWMVSVIRN